MYWGDCGSQSRGISNLVRCSGDVEVYYKIAKEAVGTFRCHVTFANTFPVRSPLS
jgi:hypothetical protein